MSELKTSTVEINGFPCRVWTKGSGPKLGFLAGLSRGPPGGRPAGLPDVRLDLDGPVSAEFDVSSFNGDIRNCFGPKAVSTSEYAPGKELRFSEGTGSARIRIKSLNGDISVCRK